MIPDTVSYVVFITVRCRNQDHDPVTCIYYIIQIFGTVQYSTVLGSIWTVLFVPLVHNRTVCHGHDLPDWLRMSYCIECSNVRLYYTECTVWFTLILYLQYCSTDQQCSVNTDI